MRRGGNAFVRVPPGEYPVKVTLAEIGEGKDADVRETYASLVLAKSKKLGARSCRS